MANRDKKVSIGRRQAPASPVPSKEGTPMTEPPAKSSASEEGSKATVSKPPAIKTASIIARKLSKTAAKKATKKTIAIQLKAKTKKASKINTKITKALLSGQKTLEGKKTVLLKNGVVRVKQIRKPKVQATPSKQTQDGSDAPPVLEPIFPVEENVDKKPKKRVTKKVSPSEEKKVKIDSSLSSIDETIEAIISQVSAEIMTPKKVKPIKKIKPQEQESLDDVMNDLTTLLTDVPKEEPNSDPIPKPKKYSKKQIEILKRKLIKKENLENALDPSASKVIDMLDLNVQSLKTKVIKNRRHSIEKFPIGSLENVDAPTIAQLTIFNNIPRSISPRTKRASKIRQSMENMPRRASPYTTRSESPARILRNGKHRKLKDLQLLEGLDMQIKRRKRLCSDLSGSELSVSKLSGYESDSSFSDLASLHGADNPDAKEPEVKKEDGGVVEINGATTSLETKPEVNHLEGVTDNNSNLCEEKVVKVDKSETDNQNKDPLPDTYVNPSLKVPDKSIILDIMKQTFNEVVTDEQDKEKRATRAAAKKTVPKEAEDVTAVVTSKFYGASTDAPEIKNEQPEETVTERQAEEDTIEAVKETDAEVEVVTANPEPPAEKKRIEETQAEVDMEIEQIASKLMENHVNMLPEVDILHDVLSEPPTIEEEPTPEAAQKPMPEAVQELKKEEPEAVQEAKEDPKPEVVQQVAENSDTKNISVKKLEIEETPEQKAIKENILQALGLQSLKAAEEAKLKEKVTPKESYTGTLKTVIKINRCEKKKGRNSLKMTLQKNRSKGSDLVVTGSVDDTSYKIMKEGATSWKNQGSQSSDTAGANRKSHYSNRSNMDGSSEHTSDGDTAEGATEGAGKVLLIPEKASSFSIHPGRLCKDECSYCFGKFGLFDTPCHIAQMKSVERQDKILANEKHLTRDSCLCDACYRHVDRKSNTPSYNNKSSSKRGSLVAPGPRQNHCHVLGCGQISSNILRRKWIIKMRKSICKVINIDLDNPGLHSIPICDEHYTALEHLMVCAVCKRRLARNHIHYLGPETDDLNSSLNSEGIPVTLVNRPVVCKLCKDFANILLKDTDERSENESNFFKEYKKRLLHFHDVQPMNEAEAEEPIPVPAKDKVEKEPAKKKKKTKSQSDSEPPHLEPQVTLEKSDQSRVPSETNQSGPNSPSDYMVDYNTLIPSIAMECGSDTEPSTKKQTVVLKKIGSAVEISKKIVKNKSDIAVQRLGSNPSISVRQLFPGEEELGLQGHIDFNNVKERTPEGWEKCVSTIQYDAETKNLWHDLQKPYGNQSSFLRHLILLEKYFRSGDLVLSPNAGQHSMNYSESVQNRLRAYDNVPKHQKSSSGIITSKESVPQGLTIINAANIPKNTPLTLSQINSTFAKKTTVPPGLISLQPAQNRPIAHPLVKVPQSQKIKFPITKNWRPNLIPIDPTKPIEKKPGLVQVVSGGKQYYITMEDYKKMCAIKRSFELKNRRQQESSVLKGIGPKKGLVITKTTTVLSKPEKPIECVDVIENSLEKLDKAIEKLESKINGDSKSAMALPKIPKSLTVIPQTVARKPSRPSSPILLITPKPKATVKS